MIQDIHDVQDTNDKNGPNLAFHSKEKFTNKSNRNGTQQNQNFESIKLQKQTKNYDSQENKKQQDRSCADYVKTVQKCKNIPVDDRDTMSSNPNQNLEEDRLMEK